MGKNQTNGVANPVQQVEARASHLYLILNFRAKMINQSKLQKYTHQSVITVSTSELKAIFEDNDIDRLEYPADEFPTPKTKIIMVFTQQSGKKPQYLELQEWFDLLEDYKESQQSVVSDDTFDVSQNEHGKDFVCIVIFRINGEDNDAGRIVVPQEERDNCINAILERYPNDQLDFSTEFLCKKCFEEMFSEQLAEESEELGQIGSTLVH